MMMIIAESIGMVRTIAIATTEAADVSCYRLRRPAI
jgi:hypothetical protein